MKKLPLFLASAALVAASPSLAPAFENEFHGLYRIKSLVTNFQASGLGSSGQPPLLTYTTLHRDYTLFEQRARLQYIARANSDLKLVTHFEIDSTWGDAAYQNGRGIGGGLAADTVNLETKNVYLDGNLPLTPINMKVGIQGWIDAYKGIFFQDDAGGAVASATFGPTTATAAYFRTYDRGGASALGKQTVDLYVADLKLAINKDAAVGASYYGAYNNATIHEGQLTNTFGINAAARVGIVDLDVFGLYQFGDELYNTSTTIFPAPFANKTYARQLAAYAAQAAAKVKTGPVTFRLAGLWTSGDDGRNSGKSRAYQNIFASGPPSGAPGANPGGGTSSGLYYPGSMLLLLRGTYSNDSDNSIIYSPNNGNRGLLAFFAGADIKFTDKLNLSANVGHALVDRKNEAVKRSATESSTDKNIGTEVNATFNYLLYPNLTASLQAAYVFLGGYTKLGVAKPANPAWLPAGTQPVGVANPYLACLMLQYAF